MSDLRKTLRSLRRRVHRASARAAAEMTDLGGGRFESTGAEGALLLEFEGKPPDGWVQVDLALVAEEPARNAVALVAEMAAPARDERIELGAPSRGHLRAVARLPSGWRRLYLKLRGKARFSIDHVLVRELGTTEAALRKVVPLAARMALEPRRIPAALVKAAQVVRRGGFHLLRHQLATRGHSADVIGYGPWIARYDRLQENDRQAIRARISSLPSLPLISVVMPVYQTPELLLRRALGSVRAQLYPRWELCVADDASTAPHVRRVLEEAAAEDERVRCLFRPRNGHISAASNSALEIARGEYLALLDHDDELAEHALYLVAEEICAHPEADLIYSDEDKIDMEDRRHDPHFKPDFSPELLWSQNFFSHLGVYRTALVRSAGGFREGFEGTQDYDLVLRCLALSDPGRIRHIPRVLYHWRAIPDSSAASLAAKPYALEGRRALEEHLGRQFPGRAVAPGRHPGTWRVRLPLPESPPLVSILIPSRDAADVLRRCVGSIRDRTSYRPYEIIVIDNDSREAEALRYLRALQDAGNARVLRYEQPFNYSAINNFAAARAKGEVLALLNNDTEVITGDWLEEMVSHALRPEIGAVGARLLYPGGEIQHAGVVTGIGGVAGHPAKGMPGSSSGAFSRTHVLQAVSAVTAACLVVRKSVYCEVGGLDERELKVAFNDVDFCLKVRQRGYRNLYTPWAELYHHESYSRGSDDHWRRRGRFDGEIDVMRRRWPDLAADPYYNPNLSLESEGLELASPPRLSAPWRRE